MKYERKGDAREREKEWEENKVKNTQSFRQNEKNEIKNHIHTDRTHVKDTSLVALIFH